MVSRSCPLTQYSKKSGFEVVRAHGPFPAVSVTSGGFGVVELLARASQHAPTRAVK